MATSTTQAYCRLENASAGLASQDLSALLLICSCLACRRPGVACSVSGVGEVIMRACLAKECCKRMLNQSLSVDEACSQVMHTSTMQVIVPFSTMHWLFSLLFSLQFVRLVEKTLVLQSYQLEG